MSSLTWDNKAKIWGHQHTLADALHYATNVS